MATGLLVTFTWVEPSWDYEGRVQNSRPAMATQFMTFIDVGPAQKALDTIKQAHLGHPISITGTIVKDVVI